MTSNPEAAGGAPRALVIDDEADARILASAALEQAGWEVEHAVDAAEALAKIGTGGFDVVSLDLRMPDVDGYELLGLVRERVPEVPVIVVSCEPATVAEPRVLRSGATAYVEKPDFGRLERFARAARLRTEEARVASRATGPREAPAPQATPRAGATTDAPTVVDGIDLGHAVWQAAPVPMAVIGPKGRVRLANPALGALLGYAADALVGLRHQAVIHPDDETTLARIEARLLERDVERIDAELRYVGAHGRVRRIQLHAAPLPTGGYVGQFVDVDAQHRALRTALVERLQDPLTGLPNRALLHDRLEHVLAGAAERPQPITVLFVDLDNLKEINDTVGHAAGDHLLVTVARRLSETARATDTVARLGGDEFVVVAPDLSPGHDTERLAHRLLETVARAVPYEGTELWCTASIGIAMTSGALSADDLLARSDRQMYRAKQAGKDAYAMEDGEVVRRPVHS